MKGLQFVQWSVVTAQKFCLFMGDLYRYKEQFLNSRNFGKAKQYYIKAQQLIPTNGMPYNQLAIISLYTVSLLNFKTKEKYLISHFIIVYRKENLMQFIIICVV